MSMMNAPAIQNSSVGIMESMEPPRITLDHEVTALTLVAGGTLLVHPTGPEIRRSPPPDPRKGGHPLIIRRLYLCSFELCGLFARLILWSAKTGDQQGAAMSERRIARLIGLVLGGIFACGLVLNAFAF
jgi:hypothetical protein